MKRGRPSGRGGRQVQILKSLKNELTESVNNEGVIKRKKPSAIKTKRKRQHSRSNSSTHSTIHNSDSEYTDTECSEIDENGTDMEATSDDSTESKYQRMADAEEQEPRPVQLQINVPTSNAYAVLTDQPTTSTAEQPQVGGQSNKIKGTPTPPICIYSNNTNLLTTLIKTSCKDKFNLKAGLEYYTVKTNTVEDHKKLTEQLTINKIEFFTYNMRSERPIKYLIKYVPTDLSIENIQKDLREKNVPFNTVTFLTKTETKNDKREKLPIPILLINAPRTAINALQSLTDICNIDVKLEPYTSKDIGQCYRCQSYGHSSTHCNKIPRCVRCAENHHTKECPSKNSEIPPKCSNCRQRHTANYRGCVAHKIAKIQRQIYTKSDKNTETNDQNRQSQRQPNTTRTTTNTYKHEPRYYPALPPKTPAWGNRQTTTTTTNPSTTNNQSISSVITEIKDLLQSFNLTKIIQVIRETADKLRQTDNSIDKFAILAEAIDKILN